MSLNFEDGARVLIDKEIPGTVVGRGLISSNPKYLIELDAKIILPDIPMVLSVIVVDPTNLTPYTDKNVN